MLTLIFQTKKRIQGVLSRVPCLVVGAPARWVSVLLLALLCSCSQEPSTVVETPPVVLARVAGQTITPVDLQNELDRLRRAGRPIKSPEDVLRDLVAYQATLHRARQAGLDQDPAVQREINNLLIAKLKERELLSQLNALEVSEDDLQKEYEARIEDFTIPAKVRLAILFRASHERMSEAKRQEIREQLQEARHRIVAQPAPGGRGAAGHGFGALAIEFSEDQASRYRGGDIGWMDVMREAYNWPRSVLETGYALSIGEVSELIEAEQGCYLVMKTDERQSAVQPLDEVRSSLRNQLLNAQRQRLQESFQNETWTMAEAEVDNQALAQLALPVTESYLAKNQEPEPPTLPLMETSTGGQ